MGNDWVRWGVRGSDGEGGGLDGECTQYGFPVKTKQQQKIISSTV